MSIVIALIIGACIGSLLTSRYVRAGLERTAGPRPPRPVLISAMSLQDRDGYEHALRDAQRSNTALKRQRDELIEQHAVEKAQWRREAAARGATTVWQGDTEIDLTEVQDV